MIGITYCGLVGKGTEVEGTLLATVDCAKCKNVNPDQHRFEVVVSLKIDGGRSVHAGSLISVEEQRNHLHNIQFLVSARLLDPKYIEAVTDILDGERALVETRAAIEAKAEAERVAKELKVREARRKKEEANARAVALKAEAEEAQKIADEATGKLED